MTRRPHGRGRCKPHARELAARYLLVAGAFGPGGHRATAGAVAEGEPAAPFVTRSLPICGVWSKLLFLIKSSLGVPFLLTHGYLLDE